MRMLAVGLAIAVLVFVLTGGHFLFLPLLFLPLGFLTFGRHRRDVEEPRRAWVPPVDERPDASSPAGRTFLAIAIGLAIGVVVFVLTGGHFLLLPFLFLPLGFLGLGGRRRRSLS
jgi:hypothetical protein